MSAIMADAKDNRNSSIDIQAPALSSNHKPTPVNRITAIRDSYWFAHGGGTDDVQLVTRNSKENKDAQIQREREEKIRLFREQQEEERIKRMKDLEHSFVAARKYREQQEEERRRRIEEARIREIERKQQVEERKRQIWEAEQERKEAILRRNLDREARIEARRNAQRNSACFAFGSSTPRTFDLDLAALGSGRNSALGCSLMSSVSSRQSVDREVSVKRATSACSLDQKSGDDCMTWSVTSLSSGTRGRQRTDLIPVTPRERSMTPHSGTRAKDTSCSPSRPQSSMSVRSEISVTSSQASTVSLRPRPAPRKPRPVSIAVTGLNYANKTAERTTKGTDPIAIPKPPRAKSTDFSSINRKPVPPPKSAEVIAKARTHPVPTKDNLRKNVTLPNAEQKSSVAVQKIAPGNPLTLKDDEKEKSDDREVVTEKHDVPEGVAVVPRADKETEEKGNLKTAPAPESKSVALSSSVSAPVISDDSDANILKISEEEKAKAALAEKRRLAREQAEREAALEKERQKQLQLEEEERKRQEELEQKRLEEEQIRLAELHQKMEEEKFKNAIEEQKQREKEEQEKKEEEMRLKVEREEQERKSREEAERQRIKNAERIRKEEQERAERKKRVDEIMARTRAAKATAQANGMQSPSVNNPENSTSNSLENADSMQTSVSNSNVIMNNGSDHIENAIKNDFNSAGEIISNLTPSAMYDGNAIVKNSDVKNGYHGDAVHSISKIGRKCVPNAVLNEAVSPGHTNGYSSHDEPTSSPEERSEKSDSSEILIDFNSSNQMSINVHKEQSDSSQLISFINSENTNSYHKNADVVNSNLLSSTESRFHQQNENVVTDLLS